MENTELKAKIELIEKKSRFLKNTNDKIEFIEKLGITLIAASLTVSNAHPAYIAAKAILLDELKAMQLESEKELNELIK